MFRATYGEYHPWFDISEHRKLVFAVVASISFHCLVLCLSGGISEQHDTFQSGLPALQIHFKSEIMDGASMVVNSQPETERQADALQVAADTLAAISEKPSSAPRPVLWVNDKSSENSGKNSSIPVFVLDINPEYPLHQFILGTRGSVTAKFEITGGGEIENIEVVESQPLGVFDNTVLEAIKSARFRDGTPKTKGWFVVTIVFDPAGTKVEAPKLQLP